MRVSHILPTAHFCTRIASYWLQKATIPSFLCGLSFGDKLCDVELLVGADDAKFDTLRVHKLVLAVGSPVFSAMLFPNPAFGINAVSPLTKVRLRGLLRRAWRRCVARLLHCP